METTQQIRTPGDDLPARSYTVSEIAQRKRISDSHLRDLIREGAGPAVQRLGRRIVISEKALLDWERKLQGTDQQAA